MVEQGAAIDAKPDDSETPLHLAAHYGQVETTKALLGLGADMMIINEFGIPLHIMEWYTRAVIA